MSEDAADLVVCWDDGASSPEETKPPEDLKRKGSNLFRHLPQERVFNSRSVRRRLREEVFASLPHRIPIGLSQRAWKLDGQVNKLFASTWLDHSTVIAGSKNNKLLLFRLDSVVPHEIKLGGEEERDDHCGIHCISINKSRSLLATGGRNVNECCIFKLPELEPIDLLKGHTDWLFGCTWLDDNTLLTGSRDKTLMVWSTSSDRLAQGTRRRFKRKDAGAQLREAHSDKVRCVDSCASLSLFASLSVDAKLVLWDAKTLSPLRTLNLEQPDELVAMSLGNANDSAPLVAVGSKRHVTLIDPRACGAVRSVDWLDSSGVRSVSCVGNLVTIGGASGKLAFFDVRAEKFVVLHNNERHYSTDLKHGFVRRDEGLDRLTFDAQHAICTHSYDASGAKLFIGGGPVIFSLYGSYAAVLE